MNLIFLRIFHICSSQNKMHNEILINSYQNLIEDTKLIRLATITTIIHSIIFVLYVLYQSYFFITSLEWSSSSFSHFQVYLEFIFWNTSMTVYFISILIILVIWYFLLPPVAEATLIYYIDSKNKSWSLSLSKWFMKFFVMFEYSGLFSLFTFFIFIVAYSRVYVMWIHSNPFVAAIFVIWFLIIVWVSILLPYVKFIIVLENKWVMDAIKESINYTIKNMRLTLRFVYISYLLHLRFLLNILMILWIPAVLIYLSFRFWYDNQDYLRTWIYIVIVLLLLMTAYINGIIEAFFTGCWYQVYQNVKNVTLPDEE